MSLFKKTYLGLSLVLSACDNIPSGEHIDLAKNQNDVIAESFDSEFWINEVYNHWEPEFNNDIKYALIEAIDSVQFIPFEQVTTSDELSYSNSTEGKLVHQNDQIIAFVKNKKTLFFPKKNKPDYYTIEKEVYLQYDAYILTRNSITTYMVQSGIAIGCNEIKMVTVGSILEYQ